MKDKIFQLLKQAYKSLGLGDEILKAHAEMLDGIGIVTEDNVQTIVDAQKTYLENLQRENDKRVTDAKKKYDEAQKAKEEEDRKAKEEADRKAKEEAERKSKDEEEKKHLEELKRNEMPEYLKKYFDEQAEKAKVTKEENEKERNELRDLLKKLTESHAASEKAHKEQMESNDKTIKELQEQLRKQAEEAREKEEKAAAEKARAEHKEKILSKARELGIPQSRIDEGFVIAEDADDETINNVLTKVSNNYKTLMQPQFGGGIHSSGEPTDEEVSDVANSLVSTL